MKYAVIYYSETGNTQGLAEEIFETIDSDEKVCVDLSDNTFIPKADVYFVGFPVHKQSCSMKVMDCLEEIEIGKLALFVTCGMSPTDKYKQKLEDSLAVWISDDVEYLGMFLCQGKTIEEQKDYLCQMNPEYAEKIREMLDEGDNHPDNNDLDNVADYARQILEWS